MWAQILLWFLEAACCNGEALALDKDRAGLNPSSGAYQL